MDARKKGLEAANRGLGTGIVRKILSVDYHRNGISGIGFHAVTFTFKEDWKRSPSTMIAILHDSEAVEGYCAVLRVSDVAAGTLSMHEDGAAFRGDHFEPALRMAVKRYSDAYYPAFSNA